jgi:hypothetical protein
MSNDVGWSFTPSTEGIMFCTFLSNEKTVCALAWKWISRPNVKMEITGPQWSHIERKSFLLNEENLRSLAKRMCPVGEGQAIIPVHLLVQLSIVCHAYQRFLEDYDREHGIHTTTDTIRKIDSELGKYLTADEQKRTDNPLLRKRN